MILHRMFLAEKWLVARLHYGHVDPREAGVGNIVNCGAAMYMAPVGIANAGDPEGAYAEAIDMPVPTSRVTAGRRPGVRRRCRRGDAPGATVDSVGRGGARVAKDGTRAPIEAVVAVATGARDWRQAIADLRGDRARSTPSGRTTGSRCSTPASPAGPSRSRSSPSRSGSSSCPVATTTTPSSAAPTTAATTRSRRWPVRSPTSVFGRTGGVGRRRFGGEPAPTSPPRRLFDATGVARDLARRGGVDRSATPPTSSTSCSMGMRAEPSSHPDRCNATDRPRRHAPLAPAADEAEFAGEPAPYSSDRAWRFAAAAVRPLRPSRRGLPNSLPCRAE